ncbi:hypothetical protein ACEPAG_5190 [Sanghuangporus baumii]
MQAQRVKITLSGPPQLTSTDLWAQIWSGLALQFPLRNLHWKPITRTSIRTIQSLDVSLLALEIFREEGASQIPLSILDKPLLNVYVVACEDAETYKNTVRKYIKEWHTQVTQRKAQEWVILNVSKSDPRQTQSGLLKMRGPVIDRIRADFNVDKKDRCAQLTWTSDLKGPAIWAEVISKVKDGVIAAFDLAVSQREEEVKRSELQKTMPGWNFCTFFVLKESLANSFEGANLLEDALIQYEELEASFFQVLKDRTLWFGNFVEPSSRDDSMPLLSITKKPYRDLIIANTVSVFDIRVYLLARQSIVLGQMGRLTDVIKKVSVFLGAFGGRLQDFKTILPDFFIESWIYSSALSAVETCDEWARARETESIPQNSFNAGKGELLTAARTQLDKLGVRLGYLPAEPPFSNSVEHGEQTDSTPAVNRRASRQISNPDILGFLDNKASFYDSYIRLTNKAIDLFVKAGRRKFALKLHGSLAALDLYRQRFGTALQTFTSLPAHYAPHHWSSLEAYMQLQSLETHAKMKNDHDRQWVHAALAFIKAYMEDTSIDLLSGLIEKDMYLKHLVDLIVENSSQIDGEIVVQDHSMISLTPLIETARCANDKDGFFLDVIVHNHLPCELKTDKFTLVLTGRGQETMEFSSGPLMLEPGARSIALFCPIPNPGAFLTSKGEVRLGHLIFQWPFIGKRRRKDATSTVDARTAGKLVKLAADPLAVHVDIEQALKVDFAGPSWISVKLICGRNALTKATLKLSSSDVTIKTKEGVLQKGAQAKVIFRSEDVSIVEAAANQMLRFDVPHTGDRNRDIIKIKADLEYETSNESGTVRRLTVERLITLALDLAVNVQDFFRGERLLMKFTISTATHQHIRISSVDLQPSDGDSKNLKVIKNIKPQTSLTVTPAQPASFVFHLETSGEVNDPLRLCIVYRLLREEVESLVTCRVKKLLPEPSHWEQRQAVHDAVVRILEGRPSWIETFEATGEVHLPEDTLKVDGVAEDLLARIKQELRIPEDLGDDANWRQFTIPLDLPRLDILASTRIDIVANPFDMKPLKHRHGPPIYASQPITAIVSIHTSLYWSALDKKKTREYKMRFQLEENIKDWLISGQKRGDFKAKDGSTHKVTLTLMALRHGELPLPAVRVSADPVEGQESAGPPSLETYQVHGAERLLILPRGGRTTFFLSVGMEQ